MATLNGHTEVSFEFLDAMGLTRCFEMPCCENVCVKNWCLFWGNWEKTRNSPYSFLTFLKTENPTSHAQCVHYLLEERADVEQRNKSGIDKGMDEGRPR